MRPNPRRKPEAASGRVGKAASGRVEKAARGKAGKAARGRGGKAARGRGGKASGNGSRGKSSSVVSKQIEGGVDTDNVNDHECGICMQPYTDPRLLHCMHTFCNQCILQLFDANGQRDVVCPMCRFVTKVGANGTLQLCRNHVIQQKVKWNKVAAMRDNGEIKCSDCEAEQATNLCVDCQWKLCDFCTTHHKRSTRFKDHSIENIEGVSNEELFEKEPILCSQHQLEIKYFCDNCKTMICGRCVQSQTHQGHVFQPMDVVMEARLASLQNSLAKSDEVCKQYEGYLSNLEIFHKKSVEERAASKKRIEDAFAELINVIQEEKQKLFNWLDEKCNSSEHALKLAKERVRHVQAMSQYLKEVSLYPKEEMFDVVQDGVTKWDEAVECMKTAADMKPMIQNNAALDFSPIHIATKSVSREDENEFAIEIPARQVKVGTSFADSLKQFVRTMCKLEKKRNDSDGSTFHEAIYPGPSGEISLEVMNVTKQSKTMWSRPSKIGNIFWNFSFKPPKDTGTSSVSIMVGFSWKKVFTKSPNARIIVTLKNHTGIDMTREFTQRYNHPVIKTKNQDYWGFVGFISWTDLIDPMKGYISNDSVIFLVQIQMLPVL